MWFLRTFARKGNAMRNPRKTILALFYARAPPAAASALSIARATFARRRLTSLYGDTTYLVMAGLVLALLAA
jgi:hypothetical protein